MDSVKAVNLHSHWVWATEASMEWSSFPLTVEGGVIASAPRSHRIPFPQELQRESIYIYWKEMIFLKFTYAPYLLKDICSDLRVKCSRLCLFLTYSLLPSSPSSGLTHSLLILPLGERTTRPGAAPGRLVVQHALGHTQAAAKCWEPAPKL